MRTQNRDDTRLRGRPAAMSDSEAQPIEIDGMDVIADQRVTLFPVTLVEVPAAAQETPGNGGTR